MCTESVCTHMNIIFFIEYKKFNACNLANVVLLHKGMQLGSVFHYCFHVVIIFSHFL